jgi:hypothetical protein
MRRVLVPALTLLTLGAAAAGCTNAPGTPATTPTPTTSPAAACPAGNWRSTEVSARGTVAGTAITLDGGAGVLATIAPDGAVTADFSAMAPARFSTQVAGAQVAGELQYGGSVSGDVELGAAGATTTTTATATTTTKATTTGPTTAPVPEGAASPTPTGTGSGTGGAWRPMGSVNWADLTLTVRLTSPAALTVVDNVKLSDVTNSQVTQAGGVIDLQPLLRAGTYQCQGEDTLVITPEDRGPTVVWTFAREQTEGEGP